MKLRVELSIIISIVMMQCAYSQSSNQDTLYRSVGIDATFINSLLPLDNPIGTGGVYLFHYIKYDKNNKFTKHGLDVNLFGSFQNNESDIDQNDARFNVEYKIGKGKRKNVFNKCYLLYGTELRVEYFLNQRSIIDPADPAEESINENLDQTFAASFGPVVGFGFNINRRISIYTEMGFYLNLRYGIDKFESEFNPNLDFRDTEIGFNTVYILPRSLVLFYHF